MFVGAETVLFVSKSVAVTWISALGLSVVTLESIWSCVLETVFVNVVDGSVPKAVTFAFIIILSETPLAISPIVQTPAFQVPIVGEAVSKLIPVGKTSVITTLVAKAGPLLVTTTVYVIMSPVLGVALFTIFTNTISVSFETVIASVKSSPAVVGSDWSPVAAVVLLVTTSPLVPAFTVAVIFNVTVSPLAIEVDVVLSLTLSKANFAGPVQFWGIFCQKAKRIVCPA